MGVRGDVLRHKKWSVWNYDNQQKVQRDIEQDQLAKEQKQQKIIEGDAEYRYHLLRSKLPHQGKSSPVVDVDADAVEVEVDGKEEAKPPELQFTEVWYDKTNRQQYTKLVAQPDLTHALNQGRRESAAWYEKLPEDKTTTSTATATATDKESKDVIAAKEESRKQLRDPMVAVNYYVNLTKQRSNVGEQSTGGGSGGGSGGSGSGRVYHQPKPKQIERRSDNVDGDAQDRLHVNKLNKDISKVSSSDSDNNSSKRHKLSSDKKRSSKHRHHHHHNRHSHKKKKSSEKQSSHPHSHSKKNKSSKKKELMKGLLKTKKALLAQLIAERDFLLAQK